MRASLILVSGLILAACSSSIPSSVGTPQISNVGADLRPADSNHITLQFENSSAYSLLFMDVDEHQSVCITSVDPSHLHLYENQIERVDIKGDNQGACRDGTREVHFLTALIQIGGGRTWKGDFHVRYDPQLSAWVGKLDAGDHNVDLCTDPPGFKQGADLGDNELIGFHFCKRRP